MARLPNASAIRSRSIATEEKREITCGGVTINAKLDGMDRLPAGLRAIIDYKTGVCETKSWMGERPDEPQLPLYALSQENVAAVAFGQVRTGRHALSRHQPRGGPHSRVVTLDKDAAAPAKRYDRSWERLVDGWRTETRCRGRGFTGRRRARRSQAGRETCKTCDQHTFCRIAEKAPFGVAHGDDDR